MARIAAQRAAHQGQRLAGPASGGRCRRVVAERIVPEQLVEPVFAIIGEQAMRCEGFLTLAHLTRILNQIKAIEVDACNDMRRGGSSHGPARGIYHLFPGPLARERRELAMLLERRRCGEMVLGHGLSPPSRPCRPSARLL